MIDSFNNAVRNGFLNLNFNDTEAGSTQNLIDKIHSAVTGNIFMGYNVRDSYTYSTRIIEDLRNIDPKSTTSCKMPMVGVVTTVNTESQCIRDMSSVLPLVIVGDHSTVHNAEVYKNSKNSVMYLDVILQTKLFGLLSELLPLNNFARKNFGYLYAVLNMSACHILDFDDDNCLSHSGKTLINNMDWNSKSRYVLRSPDDIVNPYLVYGAPEFIWPRVYPLDLISKRQWPILDKFDQNSKYDIDVIHFYSIHRPRRGCYMEINVW